MESGTSFVRVNGAMLHQVRSGRSVSLLGKLSKQMPDGMSFELIAADQKPVLVKLKMPVRESLTDYVEVYGTVDDRGNINCTNYSTIDPSLTANFDFELYNETILMCHQLPKHYVQQELA